MDQEILLEQIVSYAIGASEMIPNIAKKAAKKYELAVLPHGPHFYTGILQSAGYLLLPKKESTLFICHDDESPSKISQIAWTIWPMLWQERILQTDCKRKNICDIHQVPWKFTEMLLQHISFLSVINTYKTKISCLRIGQKLPVQEQKKLTTFLTKILPTTNIIFLQNFTTDTKKSSDKEKTFLPEKISQGVMKCFYTLTQTLKKKSEIIAYAHKDKQKDKGYACVLA